MIKVLSVLLSAAPLEHIVFSCSPLTNMDISIRNQLVVYLKEMSETFQEVLSGTNIKSVELRIGDGRGIPKDYYLSKLVDSYSRLHAQGILSVTQVLC